ncbi:MAG TPA: L-serine ammonia-lyase [Rhodospirillaceae bacterium]|nr:L-serine ammonia-lyase [Rhodospirillaceae bacterium]MAX62243.1 L-serine ammonia-lyase [Rhodospirillaceae bacterium]MBB56804.1 L-serine ammonia-lyase [Rhodospirillaceae bacterium]HBM14698.1 L-serine ammonia-lyase [Rhodospirillaceae bacterium]|tara:strand:+ start:3913 stop:5298 length:1386 start_codon:yes stop_codon:yes gene_type:complete
MFLSVFDLFKIGIGPSSSHTVGPMVAAGRFVERLRQQGGLDRVASVRCSLHGSLAWTGKGHASDRAVLLGLAGAQPDTIDPETVLTLVHQIDAEEQLSLGGTHPIGFRRDDHLVFDFGPALPGHANGMIFVAFDAGGDMLVEETYYSIGGGFVSSADELANRAGAGSLPQDDVPFPFKSAKEMLEMGEKSGLTIAEMKRQNECAVRPEADVINGLDNLWRVMRTCINRGLGQDGRLPGGLDVKRRAKSILQELEKNRQSNRRYYHDIMDWISLYAIAVNEENAAGGTVVTAPTNGAAGIIPATMRYYEAFIPDANQEGIRTFLLAASAIGGIIKHNASISGAEVGCQGEVGSASAMAAAGLAAALGATNMQIENAAEIALEHHLGMTCDPIGGLVQIPCIERNAMGAVKAVNACSLAMKGDGTHFVPLDAAIKTMKKTGEDMRSEYKETSQGGLAVNVVEC